MKIQRKILLVFILFVGFIIFSNSDCFGYTDNELIDMGKEYINNNNLLKDDFDSYIIFDRPIGDTRDYFLQIFLYNSSIGTAFTNNSFWGIDYKSSDIPSNYKHYSIDIYYNGSKKAYTTYSSLPENITTKYYFDSYGSSLNDKEENNSRRLLFSNKNIYYSNNSTVGGHDEELSIDSIFYEYDESDKLNLYELNLIDLDYNKQQHLFNICTYTDSSYYNEIMEYYNKDYTYYIYMTDYQRIMTYGERNNDNSYKYGSYIISGYIDYLIDEKAYAFYYPPTDEIRYRTDSWFTYQKTTEKQKYSDVSDFVKRFYFKLVYSEDTNDPHVTIYKDNGGLKYDKDISEPEWTYFIGGSTNIRYADYHSFLWILPTNIMSLSDKFYYVGYLGEDGKRGQEIKDTPYYHYDFDYAGGTTKTLFLTDPTYQKDIMNIYDNLMLDYMERDIQQDTSEGSSYKQGHGYATSTFQPGQVTEDTTPEQDKEFFGQIDTANNGSIRVDSNWTVLDYLKYFFGKDKENQKNANSAKGSIENTTNTIKNKFSFSNNIVNNANEIKDFIANTQETHKYYLNINHKYLKGNVCVIDLSWYAPYKPTVDAFICAFAYLAFIWHMFCRIPNLINGASATSYISDISAYKETGFGRSSNIHKGGF